MKISFVVSLSSAMEGREVYYLSLLFFIIKNLHFIIAYPCQDFCEYNCTTLNRNNTCPEECNSKNPSCCKCLYSLVFGPIRIFCYDINDLIIRWDNKKEDEFIKPLPKIEFSVPFHFKYKADYENIYKSFNVNKTWIKLNGLQDDINYDFLINNTFIYKQERIYINKKNSSIEQVSNLNLKISKLNTTINYLLSWNYKIVPACRYSIISELKKAHGSSKIYLHNIPSNGSERILNHFAYGVPYKITIKSALTLFSLKKEIEFDTPKCFDANPVKYESNCYPEPPVGLRSFETRINSSTNFTLYNIKIVWNKPEWNPKKYLLKLITDYNEINYEIPGDNIEYHISEIAIRSKYSLSLKGKSHVGYGRVSSLDKYIPRNANIPILEKKIKHKITNSNLRNKEKKNISISFWLVFILGSIILIAIALGIWFYFRKHSKEQFHQERSQYLKEIENKLPKETTNLTNVNKSESSDDSWSISPDQLIIESILGQGAFGVVHKGLLRQNHSGKKIEVAVKMLRDHPSSEDIYQFDQELQMMMALGQHPHVVSLIGVSKPNNKLLLIVEFCALGDLQHFLRKAWVRISNKNEENRIKYAELFHIESTDDNSSINITDNLDDQAHNLVINHLYDKHLKDNTVVDLSPNDLLSFARQIAIGMEFLSKNRIIHRDLAARNILITQNRTAKIADFGLSRDIYERNIYRTSGAGRRLPIKWMAIESLLYHVFTTQSDVWSFGIVLWEIVTLGGMPYPGTSPDKVFKLLNSGYRMERPANCSEEIYGLMLACWRRKPSERPNFLQIHCKLDSLLQSSTNSYLNLQQLDIYNR